jgi:hypothetical protein
MRAKLARVNKLPKL